MDSILSKFPHSHAFIDDILVVTKGSESDHVGIVEKILRKLDWKNMSSKLTKSNFAQKSSECLGHKTSQMDITLLVQKNEPIEILRPPQNLSHLKSFTGSIHSLHKYLPALVETSAPISPLLSRKNEYIWTTICQSAFENLKQHVANIVELQHFDLHRGNRIISDASHNRFWAVLEQLGPEGWRPITFAARYLNVAEKSIQPKNSKSSRWFGGRLFPKLRFRPEILRNNRPQSLSLSLNWPRVEWPEDSGKNTGGRRQQTIDYWTGPDGKLRTIIGATTTRGYCGTTKKTAHPNHLQEKLDNEIAKLLKQGHFENFDESLVKYLVFYRFSYRSKTTGRSN